MKSTINEAKITPTNDYIAPNPTTKHMQNSSDVCDFEHSI